MSARDRFAVACFLTRRKLVSARINLFLLAGFLGLLALFWVKGAFDYSFRLFLFLFPHLFLLPARDIIRDEVDSGALENPLFLGGGYRSYLRWKNAAIAAASLGMGFVLFAVFSLYGLETRQFAALFLLQFGKGIVAGLYYTALAGFLSFFLRAGTSALVVILGQTLGFFGWLLAAAQRPEWIAARLAPSAIPGWTARPEFLGLSVLVPNIIVASGSWVSVFGVGVLAAVFLGLQFLKIRSLEISQ